MRRLPPQRPRVSVRPLSLLGAGARGAGCTALLALGGTACDDRAPDRFSDCPDSPCRVEWVLSRLESEPQSALDAILVVPDGVERSLLVGVVVDRHPEMSGFLCDKLAPGADREIACDTTDRPHIWARLGPPGPILPRPGGGPSSTTLVPSVSFGPSPFPLEPLDGHPCAGRLDGVTCLLAQARQSAAVGDTQRATRACMTIASDRWRAECFFQVAEVASDDRSPSQYGEPIRLCALSGPFSPQCFAHLAMKPALLAPRADQPDAEVWADQIRFARELARLWEDLDPAFGALQVELFWARSLDNAYATAARVTGDPLAVLPAAVAPHIRAAAAMRLLQTASPSERDLATWIQALAAALDRRGEAPTGPPALQTRVAQHDFWRDDGPGEDTLPAVYYRGVSRRAWASDLEADLAICILEAAARLPAPDRDLIAQGAQYPDPLVRWTSNRLARVLQEKPPAPPNPEP